VPAHFYFPAHLLFSVRTTGLISELTGGSSAGGGVWALICKCGLIVTKLKITTTTIPGIHASSEEQTLAFYWGSGGSMTLRTVPIENIDAYNHCGPELPVYLVATKSTLEGLGKLFSSQVDFGFSAGIEFFLAVCRMAYAQRLGPVSNWSAASGFDDLRHELQSSPLWGLQRSFGVFGFSSNPQQFTAGNVTCLSKKLLRLVHKEWQKFGARGPSTPDALLVLCTMFRRLELYGGHHQLLPSVSAFAESLGNTAEPLISELVGNLEFRRFMWFYIEAFFGKQWSRSSTYNVLFSNHRYCTQRRRLRVPYFLVAT
jgi:hypothetical protein